LAGERAGLLERGRDRSPDEAARYAAAFDREDRRDLGRRAPLVALLPLRLRRAWRDRRSAI
jgi:hypothetical protein